MEILQSIASSQVVFPALAVVVVLVCAALVFVFGFHSAEQPQFDKLPLVADDRKSANKKRTKTKDKKSSPNRAAKEDGKAKSEPKKSPSKEKKEEKVKEEKPKLAEPKFVKKEAADVKKGKKGKATEVDKPVDFDDGLWEEVPKKSEKKPKAPKSPEAKKERDSPSMKGKAKETKKPKEAEFESVAAAEPVEEKIRIISHEGPVVDEEAARALQVQIEEVQRVLKEAEQREKQVLSTLNGLAEAGDRDETLNNVKDFRSNKKTENKEKQKKKSEIKSVEESSEVPEKKAEDSNVPVFDELGDTWTEAPKKSKKKARKDQ